jgi:hypothetical protein
MNDWYDIQKAHDWIRVRKELEELLMWGPKAIIDNRTPTRKIKDFLKNSLEK